LQEIETIGEARLKGGVPLALDDVKGHTMTCIVMPPPRSSPIAIFNSARVLSISKNFPAFINSCHLLSLLAKIIRMQKNWSIHFVNVCTQTTIPPSTRVTKEEKPTA
jgi:hypothetical protein